MSVVASSDVWLLCFRSPAAPYVRFWCGYYLNDELQGGEQVDEFIECEFVDVGLEELGHPRTGEMEYGGCLSCGEALLCDASGDGGDQCLACCPDF